MNNLNYITRLLAVDVIEHIIIQSYYKPSDNIIGICTTMIRHNTVLQLCRVSLVLFVGFFHIGFDVHISVTCLTGSVTFKYLISACYSRVP